MTDGSFATACGLGRAGELPGCVGFRRRAVDSWTRPSVALRARRAMQSSTPGKPPGRGTERQDTLQPRHPARAGASAARGSLHRWARFARSNSNRRTGCGRRSRGRIHNRIRCPPHSCTDPAECSARWRATAPVRWNSTASTSPRRCWRRRARLRPGSAIPTAPARRRGTGISASGSGGGPRVDDCRGSRAHAAKPGREHLST